MQSYYLHEIIAAFLMALPIWFANDDNLNAQRPTANKYKQS